MRSAIEIDIGNAHIRVHVTRGHAISLGDNFDYFHLAEASLEVS